MAETHQNQSKPYTADYQGQAQSQQQWPHDANVDPATGLPRAGQAQPQPGEPRNKDPRDRDPQASQWPAHDQLANQPSSTDFQNQPGANDPLTGRPTNRDPNTGAPALAADGMPQAALMSDLSAARDDIKQVRELLLEAVNRADRLAQRLGMS